MRLVFFRPLAWIAAISLIPACWGTSAALTRTLPWAFIPSVEGDSTWMPFPVGWGLIAGAAVYLVWHRLRPPEFLYTFTHEFTHLIFALLCGKQVSRFVVTKQSGQVTMSGTNFFITLAPYFFPLLAAFVLLAGMFIEWGLGHYRFRPAMAFLAGLTLAFHVTMTLRTLATSQPDIERGGKLFSWAIVYLFGVLFVGGTIFLSAGRGTFGLYLGSVAQESAAAYTWGGQKIVEWFRLGIAWIAMI